VKIASNLTNQGAAQSAPEKLLTVAEVAERFRVSKAWVSAHASGARQPALASIRLGRSVRFAPEDIKRFLEQNRRTA
jgi:excisionase family DNA binding protein